MSAVLYRFRAELRSRWRSWVALAAVIGLLAGAGIMLIAGARRTNTAYTRFRDAQKGFDFVLQVRCNRTSGPQDFAAQDDPGDGTPYEPLPCIRDVAALPGVSTSTSVLEYQGYVETERGLSLDPGRRDPCFSGAGANLLLADPSERYGSSSFNESRIVAGRRADPNAADEVVISKAVADRRGIAPGDTLRAYLFDGQPCDGDRVYWREPDTLRVVGVGVAPGEVPTSSGFYFNRVNLTPAFARATGFPDETVRYLAVRLDSGTTLRDLEREADRAGFGINSIISADEQTELVADSTRPVAFSLALAAALLTLVGAAVVGQIVIRQAYLESGDRDTLAALGMTPSRQFALAMLRSVFIGTVSAVIATAAAVATSAFMPLGLARRLEPSPGLSVDPAVLGIGFVGALLFVVVVSAVPAWRIARRAAPGRSLRGARSRGAVAGAIAARGAGPVPVSGIRLALDRGSGPSAVPVWSNVAGLVVAATALVGAITFSAGLTHLLDTPRLVGWNWDVVAGLPEEVGDAPRSERDEAIRRVRADVQDMDDVAGVTPGAFFAPLGGGVPVLLGHDHIAADLMAFTQGGPVGPTVIAGRAPNARNELLVGPVTLDALGLQIGDAVDVIGHNGTWAKVGKATRARMRIVGTGLVPMSTDLGRGATVTIDGLARLNRRATADVLFVRRAAGVDDSELAAALGPAFGSTPELIGHRAVDPGNQISELGSGHDVAAILGWLMVGLAMVVLAHLLVTSLGMHRRELALLRTLGFTRRQVSRAAAWQVSTYAVLTLVVSLPVGVAAGRIIWRAYAESVGVVPEPVTPWAALGVITVAAFVVANLIAAGPARRASRAAPAAILRTE